MNKTAIKNFAIAARLTLIDAVTQRAFEYEITENGKNDPDQTEVNGKALTPTELSQRRQLIARIRRNGFAQTMEEAAYTWFNRFIALRFMEVNGYIPARIRVFTDENNAFKPEILSEASRVEITATDPEGIERIYTDRNYILDLLDAQKNDTLYKYLLIAQCNALNCGLPEMFEEISGWTELLFPNNLLRNDSVIAHMVEDIPEDDWKDQVQIIGWLYQYYNSEKKDAVFAAMSNKVKVSKENIAAATQLFTPDWIVRYMVENSLGRLWVDGHADTSARSEWKYYLDEAEQTPEVQAQLAEIRAGRKDLTPEQIRFIDPCMGSGHILVYAFDVLMQIYLSCGYTERDAAQNIVRNNLWGLDLDKRAYQLAYFAVMMKARQHDRRFLTRGIQPNLSHFQDLPTPNYSLLDEPIKSFVEQFENADTYGSLITVQADDGIDKALDDFQGTLDLTFGHMEHLMQLYKILSQRYDVVCTNPPYMGMSNANATLKDFVEKNYPDSKSDFFAVFIERCGELAKENAYYSLITQQVWMFTPSYESLRPKIAKYSTVNMAHLGARAFDEISGEVVQTTAFVKTKHHIFDYLSKYVRLIEINGENDKKAAFFDEKNLYLAKEDSFSAIPGNIIGYWLNKPVFDLFQANQALDNYSTLKVGISTANNNRFVRFWHEVSVNKTAIPGTENPDLMLSTKKWFPFNNGGKSRKWYGNNFEVINWQNDGQEIVATGRASIRNKSFYFREGATWTDISTGKIGVRYFSRPFMFSTVGLCIFSNEYLNYSMALLNSNVCVTLLQVLCPTLHFNIGDIAKVPTIIRHKEQIDSLVDENIRICREDWDSFETSWDFEQHPLI
ncbi:MAG TPA: BREX-1 system adenine-specific DNA-methyltransferase PglX [Ruminococcus sp.]|nr:BREX-1 system adenine-specific DNA-methyltransferase PglX [Ruminococcus sp.]